MPTTKTIINYRNMTTVYSVWFGFLVSAVGYSVAAYALQYTTPFMAEKSLTLVQWLIILAAGCAGLAILFKYTFKQEILAWIFLEVIGLFGFVLFLMYGWNIWFHSFMVGQFLLLLILGPYLHFD